MYAFAPSETSAKSGWHKAASLGIPESGDRTRGGGSHRPYRGRGRGGRGAFFRGAGRGAPRGSMKLDNRPKELLVKGVREESVPTLREWYEVRWFFNFLWRRHIHVLSIP